MKFLRATLITILTTTIFLAPKIVFGAEVDYIPLGQNNITPGGGPAQWVQYLFLFGVAVSSIAAVGSLIYAGILWMTSGASGKIQEAKDRIKGALFGILIIAGSVLILNTINPDLVTLQNPGVERNLFQQSTTFGEICEIGEDGEDPCGEGLYCNETLGKCLHPGSGGVGADCSSDPEVCGDNLFCADEEGEEGVCKQIPLIACTNDEACGDAELECKKDPPTAVSGQCKKK